MNNSTAVPISKFKKEYLEHIWKRFADFRVAKDPALLQDFEIYSTDNIEIISDIEIDISLRFRNRFELAKYLHQRLSSCEFMKPSQEGNQPYMWSWLACVYLDQLTKNYSFVSRMEHYIPVIGDYKKKLGWASIAHRHCIREPYRLYDFYGESSKIYFSKNIHQQGNIIESIRSRNDCVSNKEIHEYLLLKYSMDDGFARPGTATSPNPSKGTGRDSTVRLAKIFKRLAVSFHAPELVAGELSKYLGPGFELE